MAKEDDIALYLAKGYKAAQVASFCEVSEEHISALIKTEGFKEKLRAEMIEHVDERIGNRYSDLEESTIKALKENITLAEISDLTRILESITRIKNSSKHVPVDALRNPTMGLTLIFNQNNQPELVTDGSNRVIAIGGTTMLPMPAKAVRDMFTRMEEAEIGQDNGQSNEQTNQLPSREDIRAITKEDLAA